jgi:hypothetical protein
VRPDGRTPVPWRSESVARPRAGLAGDGSDLTQVQALPRLFPVAEVAKCKASGRALGSGETLIRSAGVESRLLRPGAGNREVPAGLTGRDPIGKVRELPRSGRPHGRARRCASDP